MKLWMIAINIASPEEIDAIDAQAKKDVFEAKKAAWNAFIEPVIEEQKELVALLQKIAETSNNKEAILKFIADLSGIKSPIKKEILVTARKVLRLILNEDGKPELSQWITAYTTKSQKNV